MQMICRVMAVVVVITILTVGGCSTAERSPAATTPPGTVLSGDQEKHLPESIILIGLVPGRYIKGANQKSYVLAKVTITNAIITGLESIDDSDVAKIASDKSIPVITLRRDQALQYDVIYPGLINLHNHTKQNNLGVWAEAKSQFLNRFEWREWNNYKKAVSNNMNPWITYGKPVECAAFRWSELSAMVLGTTYLQGPSSCVSRFGIHRVEDAGAFRTRKGVKPKSAIQAPTDLIFPSEMTFVWNVIAKRMMTETNSKTIDEAMAKGAKYEKTLGVIIGEYCPALGKQIKNVNGANELKLLSSQATLNKECTRIPKDAANSKFIRYVYFIHSTIAGKKNYLADPNHSAVITHLSEGTRGDPYNRHELELLKVLGLDMPGISVVHGVGINSEGFSYLAKRKIGLIWSPFSNLLLYGETADIGAAKKAGVTIALGSDWTPTGSKSVLEELKVASQYVERMGLSTEFDDEMLYNMVTENPARLMGHFESAANDGYHGIGTVSLDAMGTLTIVKKNDENPYTNLVQADAKDINLVIIDGQPVYGNSSYLSQYENGIGFSLAKEAMPAYLEGLNQIKPGTVSPPPVVLVNKDDSANITGSPTASHLLELAKLSLLNELQPVDNCGFEEQKYFVTKGSKEPIVDDFTRQTGLNLDRFMDIQKLLGINLMTQSRNINKIDGGDPAFAPKYFPDLFSCNDPEYQKRFSSFINEEWPQNMAKKKEYRSKLKLGKTVIKMANDYHLNEL